jgi:hypothetical protein
VSKTLLRALAGAAAFAGVLAVAALGAAGGDVRLSHDNTPLVAADGYVSADQLAGLGAYTDPTLSECSRSRGRQNEPAVAVDPRNPSVIVGSSNDYCGVYNDGSDADGAPIPSGPIWLGYYRSEDGGRSFVSSLVPGYPGDASTLGRLARIRTASAGDPVVAWDADGRLFAGSESSGDPAGSKKTFGDVWVGRYVNSGGGTSNDGRRFAGSVLVDTGSSAPNLLGKFNDKTAIEADRTSSACRGNVYFAYARFTGNGGVGIYFTRSTDHGASFSSPMKISASIHDVQFPDIAVTGDGHVYVVFRQFADGQQPDALDYAVSSDCGKTFAPARQLTTFVPYDAQDVAAPQAAPAQTGPDDPVALEDEDVAAPGGIARDCGDFALACASGYTFFRRDTQVRATADQADTAHQWVHLVYDPSVAGSQVPSGTTYGSVGSGTGSQSAIYYARLDGATGALTTSTRIAPETTGHQLFPDIDASGGTLHAVWWDSRNDPTYSPARPIGNDAAGNVVPSLDAYAATKPAADGAWSAPTRLSTVTSNPNYEQFSGRTLPFAGDYLWISSAGGTTFAAWTDWRNTVAGTDQRETTPDETGADVLQCRTLTPSGFTGDTCPRDGGLDQDVFGSLAP